MALATVTVGAPTAFAADGTGGAAPTTGAPAANQRANRHHKVRRGHRRRGRAHGNATTAQPAAPSLGPAAGQPSQQVSGSPTAPPATGGSQYGAVDPNRSPVAPGAVGRIVHGVAYAPKGAPVAVQKAIWAANRIVGKPYVWGGGHQAFEASGYDCSGTVSFALHGAHALSTPMDSSELMSWGQAGRGRWITVYSNPGHVYAVIAGMRLDTSAAGDPSGARGPRWRPALRSATGYRVRHPAGL